MEIGVWGDSIVYGECDSEGLGWVGRLRKSFQIDDRVGVYNRGICGDTTEDMLKRFETEAESIEPDTILFAIGINDSKYSAGQEGSRVLLESFKKNMETLVEEAKKCSEKIFIIGVTSVNEETFQSKTGSRFSNAQIELYNAALKEVSRSHGFSFVDVFNVLSPRTDLHDGLHPNAGGYDKLAAVIMKAINIVPA